MMMDNQYIHHVLSTHVSAVNKHIKLINHGGCGHSALAMYNELITYDIHCDIVLVGGSWIREGIDSLCERTNTDNINDAYEQMFDGLEHDMNPEFHSYNDHLAVLFDGVLYDSDGRYAHQDDMIGSEHIRVSVLKLFLANMPSWNGTFRRANDGNPVTKLQEFYHNLFDIHLGEHACLR